MTETGTTLPERLTALMTPLVESQGLVVWGLEYIPGGRSIVRLYIESPDAAGRKATPEQDGDQGMGQGVSPGVSIDQCADVSRLVGLALEVEDCIPAAYMLEVSSPGLERVFFQLSQLLPYARSDAGSDDFFELTLARPVPEYPGRRNFNGKIVSVDAGAESFVFLPQDPGAPPSIQGEAAPVAVSWSAVKKLRRIHYAPAPEKPKKGRKAPQKPGASAAKHTPPPCPSSAEEAAGRGFGGTQ